MKKFYKIIAILLVICLNANVVSAESSYLKIKSNKLMISQHQISTGVGDLITYVTLDKLNSKYKIIPLKSGKIAYIFDANVAKKIPSLMKKSKNVKIYYTGVDNTSKYFQMIYGLYLSKELEIDMIKIAVNALNSKDMTLKMYVQNYVLKKEHTDEEYLDYILGLINFYYKDRQFTSYEEYKQYIMTFVNIDDIVKKSLVITKIKT